VNRFMFRTINGAIVNTLCLFGLAPKGFNKVRDMAITRHCSSDCSRNATLT
jgi:hypothetical protein